MCYECGYENSIPENTPPYGTAISCRKCKKSIIPITNPHEHPHTHPQLVKDFFGYTDCSLLHVPCPWCREINNSIVIPEKGYSTPFYWNKRQENPNAAYVINVECHYCTKSFTIEWDIDPRKPDKEIIKNRQMPSNKRRQIIKTPLVNSKCEKCGGFWNRPDGKDIGLMDGYILQDGALFICRICGHEAEMWYKK
jgi:hypothetical protein